MNCQEFNDKYKEYLEEGHYGLDINIPEVISFLDDIFQDLIKIPDFKYQQIKLKFNSCRFYTSLKSWKLGALVENAINKIVVDYDMLRRFKENA